jgi:hypothetical protein
MLALLCFLAWFIQPFLELIQLLAQLHKVLIYRIHFLTAFFSSTEIGFLLFIFLIPTTIPGIVRGVCAPILLAQVAMLLEMDFLGNPGHRLSTRTLLPFLALMRSYLGRFQLGFLVGTDAINCIKQREKQTQVLREEVVAKQLLMVNPSKLIMVGSCCKAATIIDAWH